MPLCLSCTLQHGLVGALHGWAGTHQLCARSCRLAPCASHKQSTHHIGFGYRVSHIQAQRPVLEVLSTSASIPAPREHLTNSHKHTPPSLLNKLPHTRRLHWVYWPRTPPTRPASVEASWRLRCGVTLCFRSQIVVYSCSYCCAPSWLLLADRVWSAPALPITLQHVS